MTTPRLVIIGIGGFGRETLDVCIANRLHTEQAVYTVDDAPRPRDLKLVSELGIEHLGTINEWLSHSRETDRYVISIGNPRIRRQIADRIGRIVEPYPPLVHPSVILGTHSHIDEGSVLCAGAVISTNVHMGRHTHINPGAIVGHDTLIGPYVSVNPAAVVSGGVTIGECALIGANATVLQNLEVGQSATVGAGSCVTKPISANAIVKGVPAR